MDGGEERNAIFVAPVEDSSDLSQHISRGQIGRESKAK